MTVMFSDIINAIVHNFYGDFDLHKYLGKTRYGNLTVNCCSSCTTHFGKFMVGGEISELRAFKKT